MSFEWIVVVHELEHSNDTVALDITVEALPINEPLGDIAGLYVAAEDGMVLLVELPDEFNGLLLPQMAVQQSKQTFEYLVKVDLLDVLFAVHEKGQSRK